MQECEVQNFEMFQFLHKIMRSVKENLFSSILLFKRSSVDSSNVCSFIAFTIYAKNTVNAFSVLRSPPSNENIFCWLWHKTFSFVQIKAFISALSSVIRADLLSILPIYFQQFTNYSLEFRTNESWFYLKYNVKILYIFSHVWNHVGISPALSPELFRIFVGALTSYRSLSIWSLDDMCIDVPKGILSDCNACEFSIFLAQTMFTDALWMAVNKSLFYRVSISNLFLREKTCCIHH